MDFRKGRFKQNVAIWGLIVAIKFIDFLENLSKSF